MSTEFKVPELGEGVKSGTVAGVLVSVGEAIEEGQPLVELETGKSVVPIPATQAGKVVKILVKDGQEVQIGQALLTIDATAAATPAPAAKVEKAAPVAAAPVEVKAAAPAPSAAPVAKAALVPAAPSVRRMARELGVDITRITGSGPGGRITFGDVKNAVASTSGGPSISAAPLPDFSKWGNIERKPLSGIRRATADQMARSWSSVAHVTQFDKADITDLEKVRKQFAMQVEASGGKLTVTAIIVKIVAGALKKFPQFNASLDLASNEIVLKSYYSIGVAVDTERGLMVPVVREADQKNITQIAAELNTIAQRARAKQTTLEEMQGGTFTITNLGGIGGTAFTPIVNTPEVAILGLSRGAMEPVWNGTAFEPRLMLPLCLSYDHRVIDGADGARFLRWICAALEQPLLLALEG